MKVIKPAYLIASFPPTQPPSGTETSAKGCFVITETPCIASTRGEKPRMGHFQIIKGRNGSEYLGSFGPQSLEAFPELNPQYFPPTLIRAEVP